MGAVGDRADSSLFVGRSGALRELNRWLGGTGPGPVVVTGGPGSGKSALLARVWSLADPDRRGREPLPADTVPAAGAISRLIDARGFTPLDLLSALAEAAGAADGSAVDSVPALVEAMPRDRPPAVVIVDALDEAACPGSPLAAEVLTPLLAGARLPLRLILGARRPLADALGPPVLLIDLDNPDFTDPAGLRSHTARCLTHGVDGSPYRGQPASYLEAVTSAIADCAAPSFLVAEVVALGLAARREPVPDPDAPPWRAGLARTVAAAMDQDLDQRLRGDAAKARELLLPLAYARGAGLPRDDVWPRLVPALTGRSCSADDLDWLIAHAGHYLTEVGLDTGSGYRLRHESFAEHLRAGRRPEVDQSAIVDALAAGVPRLPGGGGLDWSRAHPYTRASIAVHAAGTHRLDGLIVQPRFLLASAPGALAAALTHVRTPKGRAAADAYRSAASRLRTAAADDRAAYLLLAARGGRAPELARAVADSGLFLPFSTDWAVDSPPHYSIPHRAGSLSSVATARVGGRTIIVTGGGYLVRRWDAATGTPLGDPLTGHTDGVNAVAVGRLGDRTIIVSASHDKTVRRWDAATGDPIGEPISGHTFGVVSVAVGQLDGRTIIVSGGRDETVRVWDAATGKPVGDPLRTPGHPHWTQSVAVGQLDGRTIVVSGGDDSTVRRWDAATGTSLGGPLTGHTGRVNAVAVGHLDGRTIIVSASRDRTVRVWDAATGEPLGDPLTGHTDGVNAVAVGHLDGRTIIVSASRDKSVRVWDAATGTLTVDPLTGHPFWVDTVAVARLDDRAIIVSGSSRTARVWDAATGTVLGDPLAGHHLDWVRAAAVEHLDGRTGVVFGGFDAMGWASGPATGAAFSFPAAGYAAEAIAGRTRVTSVALGWLDSRRWIPWRRAGAQRRRPIAASGGTDATVRVWDATAATPIGAPLTGHTGPVRSVAIGHFRGHTVIVSGSDDATVRVWDAATGEPLGDPLTGHTGPVRSVAIGHIIVSGGDDATVRMWDMADAIPIGTPLTGHTGPVRSVAVGHHRDRTIIISGGDDATVRVWDAATGEPLGDPLTGHTGPVRSVAIGHHHDRTVIASAGDDATVRVWDAALVETGPPAEAFVIALASDVYGLSVHPPGLLAVGTDPGVIGIRLAVWR